MIEHGVEEKTGLIEQAMHCLHDLMSYQRRAFCAGGPHRELSFPQVFLLITLQERGRLTVSALAELLGVTTPSASVLIDRLEERGLLTRERDGEDRRVVHVAVTDAGRALLDEMVGVKRERMRQVLAMMDEEELGHVVGAVRGLHRVLGDPPDAEGCQPA